MALRYMITVAAALLLMAGCTAPGGGNTPEKPVTERRAKAPRARAEVDTTAMTYEHGIPVDLYSVDDGVVEEGDYFSVLMEKLGVGQTTANELIEASRKVFDVKDIRVGNHYHAYYAPDTTGDDNLAYFVYDRDRKSVVVFALEDGPKVYIDAKESVSRLHYDEVTINSSLWYDTQKAGCTPLLAIRLSDIYAWTIDFFGLQKGDSYKAVYETEECDGQVLEVGKVFYASFIHA
ncbi:MAG: hypothetical protein IJR73_00430, partial [Bacteroidales bacterium]|nr:hypothetical protein [Bacteroidales bacterium]